MSDFYWNFVKWFVIRMISLSFVHNGAFGDDFL